MKEPRYPEITSISVQTLKSNALPPSLSLNTFLSERTHHRVLQVCARVRYRAPKHKVAGHKPPSQLAESLTEVAANDPRSGSPIVFPDAGGRGGVPNKGWGICARARAPLSYLAMLRSTHVAARSESRRRWPLPRAVDQSAARQDASSHDCGSSTVFGRGR